MFGSRRRRIGPAAIGAVVLICLLGIALRPLVRTLVTVYSISAVRPPFPIRAYRRLFRYKPVRTDLSIAGRQRTIRVRMFIPGQRSDPPTIVLVHGLAFQGIFNQGLNFLGQRLAEGGFRVVVPQVESERTLRMHLDGVDDIGDTVHWAAHEFHHTVTLVGVSFGGGLVLTAAAQPEYTKDLKLVVAISGYNSIDRLGHYYLGDPAIGPDGRTYSGPPPPLGPLIMAYQYLETMEPAQDVAPLRAAMAAVYNAQSATPEGKAVLDQLLPKQHVELEELLNGRTDQIELLNHRMLVDEHAPLAAISPAGNLRGVQCPVYVLHGLNDVVIPSGEARWNAQELGNRPDVHVMISTGMGHGELDRESRRLERTRVGLFILRILLAANAG